MWFDNAIHKEKIGYMFDNKLSLENIEFEKFLFFDNTSLKVVFCSKNIPDHIPQKWKKISLIY